MTQSACVFKEPALEIECLCYDNKPCDVHIDDGGNLVCRYGSNESLVDGLAKVICPLEIESERKKWRTFLKQELDQPQIDK